MATQDTCGNCRYYNKQGFAMGQGICRRYPPTPSTVVAPSGQPATVTAPPAVKVNNIACGEYKPLAVLEVEDGS